MPQRPFSPEGVQQKITDLYQLSDSALLTQAALVDSNFKQWIIDNFTLDSTQIAYLNNLDPGFVDHAAGWSALAIKNRLDIILIRPTIPSPASKLIEMKNDIKPRQEPSGYTVTGSLIFTISSI